MPVEFHSGVVPLREEDFRNSPKVTPRQVRTASDTDADNFAAAASPAKSPRVTPGWPPEVKQSAQGLLRLIEDRKTAVKLELNRLKSGYYEQLRQAVGTVEDMRVLGKKIVDIQNVLIRDGKPEEYSSLMSPEITAHQNTLEALTHLRSHAESAGQLQELIHNLPELSGTPREQADALDEHLQSLVENREKAMASLAALEKDPKYQPYHFARQKLEALELHNHAAQLVVSNESPDPQRLSRLVEYDRHLGRLLTLENQQKVKVLAPKEQEELKELHELTTDYMTSHDDDFPDESIRLGRLDSRKIQLRSELVSFEQSPEIQLWNQVHQELTRTIENSKTAERMIDSQRRNQVMNSQILPLTEAGKNIQREITRNEESLRSLNPRQETVTEERLKKLEEMKSKYIAATRFGNRTSWREANLTHEDLAEWRAWRRANNVGTVKGWFNRNFRGAPEVNARDWFDRKIENLKRAKKIQEEQKTLIGLRDNQAKSVAALDLFLKQKAPNVDGKDLDTQIRVLGRYLKRLESELGNAKTITLPNTSYGLKEEHENNIELFNERMTQTQANLNMAQFENGLAQLQPGSAKFESQKEALNSFQLDKNSGRYKMAESRLSGLVAQHEAIKESRKKFVKDYLKQLTAADNLSVSREQLDDFKTQLSTNFETQLKSFATEDELKKFGDKFTNEFFNDVRLKQREQLSPAQMAHLQQEIADKAKEAGFSMGIQGIQEGVALSAQLAAFEMNPTTDLRRIPSEQRELYDNVLNKVLDPCKSKTFEPGALATLTPAGLSVAARMLMNAGIDMGELKQSINPKGVRDELVDSKMMDPLLIEGVRDELVDSKMMDPLLIEMKKLADRKYSDEVLRSDSLWDAVKPNQSASKFTQKDHEEIRQLVNRYLEIQPPPTAEQFGNLIRRVRGLNNDTYVKLKADLQIRIPSKTLQSDALWNSVEIAEPSKTEIRGLVGRYLKERTPPPTLQQLNMLIARVNGLNDKNVSTLKTQLEGLLPQLKV